MGSGLQMVLHVPFYFGPRMDRGGQRQEKEGKDSEDRAANRTGRWAGMARRPVCRCEKNFKSKQWLVELVGLVMPFRLVHGVLNEL